VYTSQRYSDGTGSFIARTDIYPGDLLYISYIDAIRSTPMRQSILMENYLFKCDCPMCTEMVDNYRGLDCTNCGIGTIFHNNKTHIWKCKNCGLTDTPDLEQEEKVVSEGLDFLGSLTARSPNYLKAELYRVTKQIGKAHAITKLFQKQYIETVLLPAAASPGPPSRQAQEELSTMTSEIMEWCDWDPSFLDSSLIQIACILGRYAGNFLLAKKFLQIVKADMDFLMGNMAFDNDMYQIVIRGIKGCDNGTRNDIPDLQIGSQEDPGCPIQ